LGFTGAAASSGCDGGGASAAAGATGVPLGKGGAVAVEAICAGGPGAAACAGAVAKVGAPDGAAGGFSPL